MRAGPTDDNEIVFFYNHKIINLTFRLSAGLVLLPFILAGVDICIVKRQNSLPDTSSSLT